MERHLKQYDVLRNKLHSHNTPGCPILDSPVCYVF